MKCRIRFPPHCIFCSCDVPESLPGDIVPGNMYEIEPLGHYFGPYSLPDITDFLLETLNCESDFRVLCRPDRRDHANACLLCAVYSFFENVQINEILCLVQRAGPEAFRDASSGESHYSLLIEDVLYAFRSALRTRIFHIQQFDIERFRYFYERSNGHISQVIPGCAYALPSPISDSHALFKTFEFTPNEAIRQFISIGATAVVRLNESLYNKADFVRAGLRFYDLFYPDGALPPMELVRKFLEICAAEKCIVVHCRAGTGRAGTMLGLLLMAKYGFSAREAIAWMRLVRPGSIAGPQQQFLVSCEGVDFGVDFRAAQQVQVGQVRFNFNAPIKESVSVIGRAREQPKEIVCAFRKGSPRRSPVFSSEYSLPALLRK